MIYTKQKSNALFSLHMQLFREKKLISDNITMRDNIQKLYILGLQLKTGHFYF